MEAPTESREKIHILIVEDEALIALDIRSNLVSLGFVVDGVAATGEEAVDCAGRHRPDLILMDIALSGAMDGIEAARIIKERFPAPVIYLTGNADLAAVTRARDTAPYGYVLKPVNHHDLYSTIDTALMRRELEIQLRRKNEELTSANEEMQSIIEELQASNEELVRSQEDLTASERKFQQLFSEMPDGFALHRIVCDDAGKPVDYRFLDINPSFERLTGLDRGVIGKTVREAIPGIEDFWIETYGRVALTGTGTRFESFSAPLDRWYDVIAFSPSRQYFACIFTDITGRKRMETALRESEETSRMITELSVDYVFKVDITKDGALKLSFISDNYYAITGRPPDEILDASEWLSLFHPDDREKFLMFQADVIARGRRGEMEGRTYLKNGAMRWISVSCRPFIERESGRVTAVLGAVKDITERKLADERLRASLREKETLLKEVHHRVKNNLQIITSLLNLQAMSITDTEKRELFIMAQNRVRSMALVHEKLYQSDNLELIDFRSYLQQLINEIAMTYERSKGIDALEVESDEISLPINLAIPCGLIVTELVTNAVKYAFPPGWEGKPRIRISLRSERNDMVRLTVNDNGIGMPATVNAEKSETLGLSLVNILVRQIEGTLNFSREYGTAITCVFSLQALA